MKCIVNGHHLNVGDALKEHVEDKLEAINEKYFNRAIDATVTFEKDAGHLYRAHISLRGGKDILVQASDSEGDIYAAFDIAAERVAKQLRRYKRRLRDHHERLDATPDDAMIKARAYTLANEELSAAQTVEDVVEEEPSGEPAVIAEMAATVQTMSVSDAVMRLDLSGEAALLFRNSKNGAISMIYRRNDGNIGWVDANWFEESQPEKAETAATA